MKGKRSVSSDERKKIGEQKKAVELAKLQGMSKEQIAAMRSQRKAEDKKKRSEKSSSKKSTTSTRKRKIGLTSRTSTELPDQIITDSTTSTTRSSKKLLANKKRGKKLFTESPTSTDKSNQTITDSTTSISTPSTISSPSPTYQFSSRRQAIPETTTEVSIDQPRRVGRTLEEPVQELSEEQIIRQEPLERTVNIPRESIINRRRVDDTRKKIFEISSEVPAPVVNRIPIVNPIEDNKPLYNISSIVNKDRLATLSDEDTSKLISGIIAEKIRLDQRQKAANMVRRAREDLSLLDQNGGDDLLISNEIIIPKIIDIQTTEHKPIELSENTTEYDSPSSIEFNKKYINSFGLQEDTSEIKDNNEIEINGKVILNKLFDYIGVKFN
jgi:hypothetical protein